ncbi:MAG: twin-arginine translocase TatA/TatE family subunit [Planctomycetaceae bacterium]|nr:twin-arginine translocase TatA/TatE family subunit [Planctomycetaceae bacterium]
MFGINVWEILVIGTAFCAVNVLIGLILFAAFKSSTGERS